MMTRRWILAACVLGIGLPAAQEVPERYQVVNCVKVARGKGAEFTAFARGTLMKMAQVRANAGELSSWTMLRSVMPAGEEARCDYLLTTTYEGKPGEPRNRAATAKALAAAGIAMSTDEFYAKRDALSRLVNTEIWRTRLLTGKFEKGHYMALNMMRVRDVPGYAQFEQKIWLPMAEQWVRDGTMSGWAYGTRVYPAGTEREFSAYTVDIYPNWNAVFSRNNMRQVFEKVHAGKSIEQTLSPMNKMRDLARRDLLHVIERVTKQ